MMHRQQTKFKQTEIGMIPEDWKRVVFSEVIDVNPYRELKQGSRAKYVSMAALTPFSRKIFNVYIKEYKGGTKFKKNDTLFARITPCLENGKTAFVDFLTEGEVGFGSTEFIVLSSKENITDPCFVYYLSRTPEIRMYAIKSMTGTSGRQRVENDIFDSIIIRLPKLTEQKAIAKILSDLDAKIELNQQMNKTLEQIGQAIFKHWFVDFEFPNEEGKPYKSSGGPMVYNEELGKEIPKGWKVGKMKDVLLEIESGSRPKGGADSSGIPSIGAENILGLGKYDYTSTKYVPESFYDNMKQGKIKNFDVLIYKDGARLGRKTIFGHGFPYENCCINEHVFILRTNSLLNQFYLYFWLDLESTTNDIINLNTNTAQPGITKEGVKGLPILIPDKKILNTFEEIMKSSIKKIFKNCLENLFLSQLRDSLLPKLMSGKIRVPVKNKGDKNESK
ncbi:MAG: restriction endonuclease subunit S [candidate division WOR-3 bacterium]|nr:restriction endonuclease subunit S [candidate division WOR-3 bacterium]